MQVKKSFFILVLPGIAIFPLGCWLYCTDWGKAIFIFNLIQIIFKLCLRCAGLKEHPLVCRQELTEADVKLIVDYETVQARKDAASYKNEDGESFGDNAWVIAKSKNLQKHQKF